MAQEIESELSRGDEITALRADLQRVQIVLEDFAQRLRRAELALADLKHSTPTGAATMPIEELNASNDE